MTLFNLMGIISTIALALPIIVLIVFKLTRYRSFPALFINCAIGLVSNLLLLKYITPDADFNHYFGIVCNLLDIPLTLLFLTYFGRTVAFRKKMVQGILVFIGYELLVIAVFGFTQKTSQYVMIPGLVIVLALSLWFFIYQTKVTIMYHKATGKALMISSILFSYVGFAFAYTVIFLIKTPYKQDTYLVFFLIILFSSIAMAAGLILEKKRIRQLAELKITREELKAIYGDSLPKVKATAPLETIAFKFDEKQWN